MLALQSPPALAHNMYLFAQVRGTTIVGRAYFPGNVGAQQTDVIARDPSGRELGRTQTDEQGDFTLPANVRTDYRLMAATADGHSANYVVSAAELPGSLPTDSSAPLKERRNSNAEPAAIDAAAGPKLELTPTSAQLEALQNQIAALREQIDQTEHRMQLRDLLGGIGYILGLAGLGLYMKARGRTAATTSTARN